MKSLHLSDVDQTSLTGWLIRWTRTKTTLSSNVAPHGTLGSCPGVSKHLLILLGKTTRGILKIIWLFVEDRAHIDAQRLWPCADNAISTTYQETSTTVTLAVLQRSNAFFCGLLPTEFRRVELTTSRIRMRSELEWIYGITKIGGNTFAKKFINTP